jgi:hypothetical protein
MFVSVTVDNKHRLMFEAHQNEDNILNVQLISRTVHLGEGDRFIHFLDPRNTTKPDRPATPLAERAKEVFGALLWFESSSPIVKGLQKYSEMRLPYALGRLDGSIPSTSTAKNITQDVVQERLHYFARNPHLASALLTRIVSRIEAKVPTFFKTEHELGTHAWLKSGCLHSLPFAVACEPEKPNLNIPFGFANPRETHVPFQINTQTAFIPKGITLSPLEIVSALSRGGGCGESLQLVNRAAAMRLMTIELKMDIDRAQQVIENLSSRCPPHQRSYRLYSAMNGLFGGLGLAGASLGAYLLQSGISLWPLGLGAASAAIMLGAGISQIASHKIRNNSAQKASREIDRAQLFLESSDAEIQSVLAATLLRYIDQRGASRKQKHNLPDPLQHGAFEQDFEGMDISDERAFRHIDSGIPFGPKPFHQIQDRPHIDYETQTFDEELSQEVTEQIHSLLKPELICLHHCEVAAQHWHLMHAIDVCSSFAQRCGLPISDSHTLPLRELLLNAQKLRCDKDGYFRPMYEPFEALRRTFDLGDDREKKAPWQFSAQALLLVDVLESSLEGLAAQEIAIEEIMR